MRSIADSGSGIDDAANLDFPPEQMEAMGQATLRRVVRHLSTLEQQPACGDIDAEELCRSMRESPPEHPQPIEPLLEQLFEQWVPRSITTPGPGFFGYIPGGGLFGAALADLITNTTNRYTGIRHTAPALVQLEANVLEWFRDWMAFPPSTRGLLTTGGSMANFNAIVCARHRLLGPEIRRGVIYVSDQVHHSAVKSAKLAGIYPDRVRIVPVDQHFRIQVDALAEAIRRDRAGGLTPFMVVSTAGTTNTGAVDPMQEVGDVCATEGLWHHVDGAYGAFFHMCEPLRPLLAGLPRADSLSLDPHKGLFLPYGTGALLVRDGAALRGAHSATAGYLPSMDNVEQDYDPSQHGPDLSRGFPGLRVWLCLKLLGAAKLRAAIAEKRDLAVSAAHSIGQIPGVVMVAPPQLSLFAFHLGWPGSSLSDQNDATRLLIDRVAGRGKVMLTGCMVKDRFLARVCVLSFRSRKRHVDTAVQHLADETAAILSSRGIFSLPSSSRIGDDGEDHE
jgi:aromatic-L-amino-acid/L-tryptophan decarboxylase